MLLSLDFGSDTPIYMQIRNQIVLGIAGGKLLPGERLPSIRTLSAETGVNMMTVNKAYQQLKQEGFIAIDRRSGARVGGSGADRKAALRQLETDLKLLFSQARLSGVEKEDVLRLCAKVFEEMEGKK